MNIKEGKGVKKIEKKKNTKKKIDNTTFTGGNNEYGGGKLKAKVKFILLSTTPKWGKRRNF